MTEMQDPKTPRAKTGDAVSIRFTCKFEDGTVFDTSAGKEPLSFVIGGGQVVQGLEEAVAGMSSGESKAVIVPPDKAFGPHLTEKVHIVNIDQFPRELQPLVGMKFEINQEDGTTNVVRVTDVTESTVTLDTNHPLAGKNLFFEVELIAIRPSKIDYTAADTFYKKGVELQDKGRTDEAISYYQKTIDQNPSHPGAYYNLGVAFQGKGLLDQAILYYEIAIGLKQDLTDAHQNLGVAFKEKGKFDDALICFERVLQLKPDHADACYNIGNVLVAKGLFKEAAQFYHRAIEIDAGNADAHWNTALLELLAGNFEKGWKGYEWRRKLKGVMQERGFAQPLWDGSDIHGRTILLYAEQGFRDTLQFARYAPLVAQRGARIIIECQPELTSLLRHIEGVETVIPSGETPPEFDLQYPLLSLPLMFNTTLETIPAKIPYLSVDPEPLHRWQERVASNSARLKIGLAWSGDPGFRNDRSRSCRLEDFSSLSSVENSVFYSLQKGEASTQAGSAPNDIKLIDYTAMINDFSDTAALIQNLDLVISVDTAVAHLAGALGKPVWTILPFVPDWRWMLAREDSPWYPTMRLFRQQTPGDWGPVIARVKESLDEFVRSKT